uniref:Uncharacterized protein n=1 Tax=Chromera velia CCMP2878 TaxID=1169474 RepID=A0A0K6S5S6_9ALVE|eukprot:Cvel_2619.t1-p1 / transcript=Cvel_2619.t1 / gene=Cvel_2619 / organism=Chromera_velia_CCMP2878 / gene_product=hypothetical protein / transcript_product=hypothetical protein / location=Cvel_scaffold104:404-7191(+) / protein_length=1073 / sequence_SO=supercontig / SO=protein_coding / is_pseudo=false
MIVGVLTKNLDVPLEASETILIKASSPFSLFQLVWTLHIVGNPPGALSVRLLPHEESLPLQKHGEGREFVISGAALFEAPASGTVQKELSLEVDGEVFKETSLIALPTEDTLGGALGSSLQVSFPANEFGLESSFPAPQSSSGSLSEMAAKRLVFRPITSGDREREGNDDESFDPLPLGLEGGTVCDQPEASSLPPAALDTITGESDGLGNEVGCSKRSFVGDDHPSHSSRDPLPSSSQSVKEERGERSAVSLFGIQSRDVEGRGSESSPQSSRQRKVIALDPRKHWQGARIEQFHVRIAFNETPEILALLQTVEAKEGGGAERRRILQEGFRQLLTDSLDRRGAFPSSEHRCWSIGTDSWGHPDRSVALFTSWTQEGEREAILLLGMFLRRLRSESRPTVEDLEFWVDGNFMLEVLREWNRAPGELISFVQKCKGVETRRATTPVKLTLEVLFDAGRAMKAVDWQLPRDPIQRVEYLSPLWRQLRWFAGILLGGRRAELSFLHSGELCISRLRERSFVDNELVHELSGSDITDRGLRGDPPSGLSDSGLISLKFPIFLLPSIETAGSWEAVGHQVKGVLSCLRPGFYKYLLRRRENQEPLASQVLAASRSGVSASTDNAVGQSSVPCGDSLTWGRLAGAGCIRDVWLSGTVDFQSRAEQFLLNVIFDIWWEPQVDDKDALQPAADRFALVERILLKPFEDSLRRWGGGKGIAVKSRNRGKERVFRVVSKDPTQWPLEVEFLMSLVRNADKGVKASEVSFQSAKTGGGREWEADGDSEQACLLVQQVISRADPLACREGSEFQNSVDALVHQVLTLFPDGRRVAPSFPRVSVRNRKKNSASQPVDSEADDSRKRSHRHSSRESVWNNYEDLTRDLFLGSLDPHCVVRLLWGGSEGPQLNFDPPPTERSPHEQSSTAAGAPVAALFSHPSPSDPVGAEALALMRKALMGLRGKVGIELRVQPQKHTSASGESPKRKRSKHRFQTGEAASVNADLHVKDESKERPPEVAPSIPWVEKRSVQDGRLFFLPKGAHKDEASHNRQKLRQTKAVKSEAARDCACDCDCQYSPVPIKSEN